MENKDSAEKEILTNYILHKANTRGHADHGWLKSYHSLVLLIPKSERMNFGYCGKFNDDTVSQGCMVLQTSP
jgi:hypothetical protein